MDTGTDKVTLQVRYREVSGKSKEGNSTVGWALRCPTPYYPLSFLCH